MNSPDRLAVYQYLRNHAYTGKWAQRILSEIGYLCEISEAHNFSYDSIILPVIDQLKDSYEAQGAITKDIVLKLEQDLYALHTLAKSYDVTCVAHAHIDMNWLWGFHETVSVTVDTFRTMLSLMDEYPDFVFSQSQASVYRIIEKFSPEMLPKIRKRILEGRWELTASSWVENDKNMPSGESMARHLLYTRKYLSNLFDIPQDTVKLDFEPDTFGHTHMLPEILQNGGIQYYYHCRGYDRHFIYNWTAPSGANVLVYREPNWYNQTIGPDLFLHVPSFCAQYNIKSYLKVYGVGDHGGGPTRRDLDRLINMNTWPLFPTIHFGTLQSFFDRLEPHRSQFPVVDSELNYVFTGCYSSQARIKRGNKLSEDRLNEAEILDSMASGLCRDYQPATNFQDAWERVLFNQFHDILPGSGITETRDYAMGQYQEALAIANVNANRAMCAINNAINTEMINTYSCEDTSVGAGAGFGVEESMHYGFSSTERGTGSTRIHTLFNTTQYSRKEIAEITVWDWPGDPSQICARTTDGKPIPCQVTEKGTHYWGHQYLRLAVYTTIPATGYTTIVLEDGGPTHISMPSFLDPRCDYITDENIILENAKIQAAFHPGTMQLVSLIEKASNRQLIDPTKPAGSFRYIMESSCTELAMDDITGDMSAWRVGRYMTVENLSETASVSVQKVVRGKLRDAIHFTVPFQNSVINGRVSLDQDSDTLCYNLSIDWREFGSKEKGVPQLNFHVPLNGTATYAKCAIPLGIGCRSALNQDVPCNGFISAETGSPAITLMSDCKYGFRHNGNSLSVTLLRASYHPDPAPDIGNHTIRLGICVNNASAKTLLERYDRFVHPIHAYANTRHSGQLSPCGQLIRVEGIQVVALKQPENAAGLILRLYNPSDTPKSANIQAYRPISVAEAVTVDEKMLEMLSIADDGSLTFPMAPYSLATLHIVL